MIRGMDNVIEIKKKMQEYRENTRRLNNSELILKLKQAQMLINTALDILEDPEVNSSKGIINPEPHEL
jgi:hypothetical protein